MKNWKRKVVIAMMLIGVSLTFNSCNPRAYAGLDIDTPTIKAGPFRLHPHVNVGGPIR